MTSSRGSAASMLPANGFRPSSCNRHSFTVRLRMVSLLRGWDAALLGLQIAARTLPWPRMGIHRRGFQIRMAKRRRHERDRRAVVDGVGGMGMPQPMHGRRRVHPGAAGDALDQVVDGPVGQGMARVANRLEYGR